MSVNTEFSEIHSEIMYKILYFMNSGAEVLALVLSSLTVTAVLKFDYLKSKSSNLLILSLAVADVLSSKNI